MLEAWLDFHRQTLLAKCAGLTPDQLSQRSAPPSGLSLLGLVRHMAEVERGWFRRRVNGEDVAFLFSSEADPDGERRGVRLGVSAMIEEYARHNGHADLLRERSSGRTGM